MNYMDPTGAEARDAIFVREAVTAWLGAFERALTGGDAADVAALIEDDGNWRDVLAFTWRIVPYCRRPGYRGGHGCAPAGGSGQEL